jgi:hypothetical protein
MGVNDIIIEFPDQFANLKARRQIDFSPHGNRKNSHPGLGRPRLHRGAGLADQAGGDPAFIETDQQIQGLLFPAAPGPLGVDMQNFHVLALSG